MSLKKYWKFLYKWFESKGFYISYKWMKPKKKEEEKEIVYMYHERYVIPEPSPDAFDKEKKPKYWFFNKNQSVLYFKFDTIRDPYFNRFAHVFFHKNVYTTGILKNFTKFPFTIKFDFFWAMSSILSFYNFNSFGILYCRIFFSEKKFKLLNQIVFKDFFTTFINHNKPFVWWKGKKFFGKKQGTALVLIKRAIYRQLIYETLGISFKFSDYEKKLFLTADVDPFDKRYYWPTRRLNLIGISTHSGKISSDFTFTWTGVKDRFDYIKRVFEKNLWFKVIKQLFFWWDILLQLLVQDRLFFDKYSLCAPFELDPNGIAARMPQFFLGKKNYFFSINYLYDDDETIPTDLDDFIIKSSKHNIYRLLSFHASIKNFDLFLEEKVMLNRTLNINNKLRIACNGKYFKDETVIDFLKIKKEFFDGFIIEHLSNEIFQKLKIEEEKNSLYSLPDFIKTIFILFSYPEVRQDLLEEYIIKPLLNNHKKFSEFLKKAYNYNYIYNKPLNLFKTSEFKNLKYLKVENYPIFIHKLFHSNLELFLDNDKTRILKTWFSEFKFFNLIYLAEQKNNVYKNLRLSEAITPYSLFTMQFDFLPEKKKNAKAIKNKYNVLIIFNIYFFLKKILKKKKIIFHIKYFLLKYLSFVDINLKKIKNLNISKISIWFTNWFDFFIVKPQEFHHFSTSDEYLNWFSNNFDPSVEKALSHEELKNLNFCLPKIINLNHEWYILKKEVNTNSISLNKEKSKNIQMYRNLYLKKLKKKLYNHFLIKLLTPRLWLTQYFKNVNLNLTPIYNFYFCKLFNNTILFNNNSFRLKYDFTLITKQNCFWFVKSYFTSNNIFLNHKNTLYIWLKKHVKN